MRSVLTPSHHPQPDDLVGYAAGSMSQGLDIWVACHLTFCAGCRQAVANMDALGAELWVSEASGTSTIGLESMLARLDDREPPVRPRCAEADEVLPAPLRRVVGSYRSLPLRRYPLGVRHMALPQLGEGAFLLELPGSLAIPAHRHDGVERVVVLEGGFQANGQSYGPGDVSEERDHDVHEVIVDPDARCVCLFVVEGRIIPEHPLLKIVAGWVS